MSLHGLLRFANTLADYVKKSELSDRKRSQSLKRSCVLDRVVLAKENVKNWVITLLRMCSASRFLILYFGRSDVHCLE